MKHKLKNIDRLFLKTYGGLNMRWPVVLLLAVGTEYDFTAKVWEADDGSCRLLITPRDAAASATEVK